MTYQEAEAYINDTPRFTTKNTLENTKAVLEKMGHPERRMKLIHVAGSNGKGSVIHSDNGRKADGAVYIPASGGYQ